MTANNLPAYFFENVKKYGDKHIFIREKNLGIWQSHSWAASATEVEDFALGLASLGFKQGDRMCIVGDNRPQLYWSMLSAESLGGVPVPLFQDSIEREMEFIVDHAEARFAMVEDQEQVDKMLGIKEKCAKLEYVIYKDTRGMRNYDHTRLLSYEDVKAKGREFAKGNAGYLQAEIAKIKREDMAIVCYTSGTTGKPKGVMISHHNLIYTCEKLADFEKLDDRDSIMAYLPMAWVGDFFFSFGMAIVAGITSACPESGETVLADTREVGPSLFFAPPRIWENLLTTVMIRMDDASAIKRTMFKYFIGLAERMQKRRNALQPVSLLDKLLYQLGKVLVYGPLKDNLGVSKLKHAWTAGEAIGPEIYDFFRSLGINLKQLYGMTESTVAITMPRKGDPIKPDTCGPPLPWVDIKIAENGEVLLKSEGVCQGYLKNPEATAETIVDGWLRTGDAGFIDHDGHLKIIDRAKDVGKLNNGALFAPKYIENKLKFSPYIKEAVSIGQDREFVTVMINIDMESVGNWAERNDLTYTGYTDLAQNPKVNTLVASEVLRVNRDLAADTETQGAQIKRFLILHKELDPDDEEITRTRKVRRGFIAEKYKPLIDALFSNETHVETEAKVTFEDGREATIRAKLAINEVETFSGASAAA